MDELWPADQLDRLLAESDVVILCVPLNAQTLGMIAAPQLARMKRGAILINVARGPIVVEKDLVAALESGHLGGAGSMSPKSSRCRPTAACGTCPTSSSRRTSAPSRPAGPTTTTNLVCENLRRYFAGRPLINLVDKRLGYPTPAARRGEVP